MTADAAQVLLSGAGIPFTVVFREAEEAEVGLVLEVDPAGGSVIAEGGSVVLVVGKRKEPVEPRVPMDLVRKTVDAAQALLSGAGIPSTVTFREAEEAEVGLVLETSPAGGTLLAPGGSVHLLVGKAKEGLPPTPLRGGDLSTEIPAIP
jgi:beta-lactam-binding protein with PASTA domain